MDEQTIENPVSGERMTFLETARGTGGARTVGVLEVRPGGGVPIHRHSDHEERIEVLEGEIELTLGRKRRRVGPGEQALIAPGQMHGWRNPSPDRPLRFRGTMNPGNPGFERFLRVLFGLARSGEVRPNGLPRRLSDLALLTEWDPSVLAGPLVLLGPVMRLLARRARARGRAAELLARFDADEPAAP